MFTIKHRFEIRAAHITLLRGECETTEDTAWIGRRSQNQRLRKHTLRGVPGRLVDVLLPDTIYQTETYALEIGTKSGKYDGHLRTRITVRRWQADQYLANGQVLICDEDECPSGLEWEGLPKSYDSATWCVVSACWAPRTVNHDGANGLVDIHLDGGSWIECFPRLKSDLSGYDLPALVCWQWKRYYKFLDAETVEPAAQAFESLHPEIRSKTLAEANRIASRYLYRIARDLGWRKLTIRERASLAMSAQWVRQEDVAARRIQFGFDSCGVGQYTREASQGREMLPLAHSTNPEDWIDEIVE